MAIASAGTAVLPEDATTIKDLLVAADHALRAAKLAGKDRVVTAAEDRGRAADVTAARLSPRAPMPPSAPSATS